MNKFNKGLNGKIISVIVVIFFLVTNNVYPDTLSTPSQHLRKQIDFNNKEEITPKYLCIMLAAAIHKSLSDGHRGETYKEILEAVINKYRLPNLLEEIEKQNIQIEIDKEGNVWISHEPDNIYIVVYKDGQFEPKAEKAPFEVELTPIATSLGKKEQATGFRVTHFFKGRFKNLMTSKMLWFSFVLAGSDFIAKKLIRVFLPVELRGGQILVPKNDSIRWLLENVIGISHTQHIRSIPAIWFVVVVTYCLLIFSANRSMVKKAVLIGSGFALAGVLSNFLDLKLFGAVTNWLVISIGDTIVYTNIADIFVVLGFLFLAIISPLTLVVNLLRSCKHQKTSSTVSSHFEGKEPISNSFISGSNRAAFEQMVANQPQRKFSNKIDNLDSNKNDGSLMIKLIEKNILIIRECL